MTLIVSEVSRFGILMVADSAITEEYPASWTLSSGNAIPPTVRTGAQKIVPIQAINAAIAVWGVGSVGMPNQPTDDVQIPIDLFLADFASSVSPNTPLEHVGNQLAALVNERIRVGEHRGGFHLAGYDQENGRRFPVLYHIHTGPGSDPPHEPLSLHRDYPFAMYTNRGHSFTDLEAIDRWLEDLETGIFHLRNGLYDVYAYFSRYLWESMVRLESEQNFICPDPSQFSSGLEARACFLKLLLRTVCEFYRLSNRLETIAMPISCITISPEGIQSFEPVLI